MSEKPNADDLREEYDVTPERFRAGVRGKHTDRYAKGVDLERPPARRRTIHRGVMVAGVLVLCSGCGKPSASGNVDEVVVVTSSEIRAAHEQEIVAALQPRAFALRRERIFEVAYLEPTELAGSHLRRMRQVLLIGSAREPLIAKALGDRREEWGRPVVLQARDVWAQNQVVTVALLPESAEPGVLEPLLPKIRDALVRQLENASRIRMALTPTNEQLAERLRREDGFTLLVPYGYDFRQPEPGLFVFRHEGSAAGPVVRTITVDSRARATVDWTAEASSLWRADLAERLNRPPHVTDTLSGVLRGQVAGQSIIQVQGVWSTPPGEWPFAGPFISRMVECPERVFLIDAWIYAPVDEKYEEMYRLDLILDTFRCPTEGRTPAS